MFNNMPPLHDAARYSSCGMLLPARVFPPSNTVANTANTANTSTVSLGKRVHSDLILGCGQELTASERKDGLLRSIEPPPPNKRRRTVRFATVAVARIERSDKALWYSKQDLQKMKSTAKQESKQLNLDASLAPAYNIAEKSEDQALPRVASTIRCNDFESQRGLERWSSQMLMLSRCVTIVRARTEVILAQIDQTVTGGPKDPQRIADSYKEASTHARTFARLLGIADAQAASAENAKLTIGG